MAESVSYGSANEPEDTEQPSLLLQQDFITCVKGGLNTHWLTSSISPRLRCRRNLCRPFMYFFSVWILFRQENHHAEVQQSLKTHTCTNTIPTKLFRNTLKHVVLMCFPHILPIFSIRSLFTALNVHKYIKKARDRCTHTGQKAAESTNKGQFF